MRYWTDDRIAQFRADYVEGGFKCVSARNPHLRPATIRSYVKEFGCVEPQESKPKRATAISAEAPCRQCGAISFVIGDSHDRRCRDSRACAKRVERGGIAVLMPAPQTPGPFGWR